MVLVDTSVWIHALANRAPYTEELARLLGIEDVAGHEMVYGELLIGDRGGRKEMLAAYQHMDQATTIPHREVVAFVRDRGLHGRGIGWIDVHLLASTIVDGMQLWTAGPRLRELAAEFGVEYERP
jgi:hypothetical protein